MSSNKILHVVSSMNPVLGGVCKAVETIALSLLANGVHNEVLSLDASDSDFVVAAPFKIHALGNADNPWGYNATLVPWLKDHIKQYDFVIVHGLWLYSSYAVYKAFKALKKQGKRDAEIPKYFVMPHGMLDPYFQQAKGRRLKAWRNTLYWKLIEQNVVNQAAGVLFTCQEEQLLARNPFSPYAPKQELVVGLGVEAPPKYTPNMDQAFFSAVHGLTNRPFLLFLSRIHEKKGVDILLDAYQQLADTLATNADAAPSFNLPALVIAGPGLESEYGKMILEKVSNNAILEKNVYFPGMLTGDAKWGAFYNCEAFVLPSHQENFGIAIVEALACAKPVLISNQINIWKEIANDKGGIVENDTLLGTVKLLTDWMEMPLKEKELMGTQAEMCYKRHFSLDAQVANWKQKVLLIN